jgi:hypothetical protein
MANVAALKHRCPAFLGSAPGARLLNLASPSLAKAESGNEEVSRIHYGATFIYGDNDPYKIGAQWQDALKWRREFALG